VIPGTHDKPRQEAQGAVEITSGWKNTAADTYPKPGRCTIAVKVIDIFGNDTMTLIPISAG